MILGLISGEVSLSDLYSHGLISVNVERKRSVFSSSSYKDISLGGLKPHSYDLI